ncbi:uncharacterized protein [Cardiocondyla obscurior]|uniref:uncharacterized protein n=1 Tax=Cardiocondyla obscurior TaxID=286306 RepID=UPI0039657176
MFTLNGSYKWVNSLQRPVLDYNTRKHRTISMRPIDITPENADKLLAKLYNHLKIAAPAQFKVSNSIRVSKFKTLYEESYTPNWTTEMFRIIKVQKTNPVTYLLEDFLGKPIDSGFCEHEFLPVKNSNVYLVEKVLRKQRNNVYVKWLGLNNSHNSWINKNAPAIFQKILSSVIRNKELNKFAVNYIDDILVYSKPYEDHIKHVEQTLKALKDQRFKLNERKCQFA